MEEMEKMEKLFNVTVIPLEGAFTYVAAPEFGDYVIRPIAAYPTKEATVKSAKNALKSLCMIVPLWDVQE